jgi:hypothetical protein
MSDEILTDGDEGTIDGGAIEVKRKPGRPRKEHETAVVPVLATDLPVDETPLPALPTDAEIPPSGDLSTQERGMVMTVMEKILDRLDADPHNAAALQMFERVLEMHGEVLKQTAPMKENKRHPDVSAYNPLGERDHPRPQLRRPVYFLGAQFEQQTLTLQEIETLNQIETSMESADGLSKATILRTQAGGEILYISVPFKDFDDLRGLKLMGVLRDILGGTQPQTNDTMADRINALLQANEQMAQRLAALEAAQGQHVSVS